MAITSEIEKAQVSCSYQNISFFKTDGVSFHWNCKPQTSDPRSLDKGRQSRDINQITHYGIQGPYAHAKGRVNREYTDDSEIKSSLFYYFSLLKAYFSAMPRISQHLLWRLWAQLPMHMKSKRLGSRHPALHHVKVHNQYQILQSATSSLSCLISESDLWRHSS